MYTWSPRASGVHIRQTTNAHGITVMYHIAHPLVNWNQLKPWSMQVHNPIVFIGKVVGIDCGFPLTGNFQCIYIYSKGYTLWLWVLASFLHCKYHNIVPQSNLTSLPINWVELSLCNITKLNTTSESYKLCYIKSSELIVSSLIPVCSAISLLER